jgi:hypothetical protein
MGPEMACRILCLSSRMAQGRAYWRRQFFGLAKWLVGITTETPKPIAALYPSKPAPRHWLLGRLWPDPIFGMRRHPGCWLPHRAPGRTRLAIGQKTKREIP